MTAAPLAKGQALINEVADLVARGIDPFSISRLEREAKKLIKIDPARAYTVLGMLAAAKGEFDATRSYFNNALKLAPSDLLVVGNYGVALHRLGLFHESAIQEESELHITPGSAVALRQAASTSFVSCRFRQALEYLHRFEKVSPDQKHILKGRLEEILVFFREGNIPFEAAEKMFDVAYSLYAGKYVPAGGSVEVMEDEEDAWFSHVIQLRVDVEAVCELNQRLVDLLLDEVDPSLPLVFQFQAVS